MLILFETFLFFLKRSPWRFSKVSNSLLLNFYNFNIIIYKLIWIGYNLYINITYFIFWRWPLVRRCFDFISCFITVYPTLTRSNSFINIFEDVRYTVIVFFYFKNSEWNRVTKFSMEALIFQCNYPYKHLSRNLLRKYNYLRPWTRLHIFILVVSLSPTLFLLRYSKSV